MGPFSSGYGFAEEAGGGTGRQRPWRIVIQEKNLPRGDADEELDTATTVFRRHLAAREYEALRAWFATSRTGPRQWQDAAFVTQNVGWCTAEELTQLGKDVAAALDRFVRRVKDPAARPPGARPVRLLAWGIPAQPIDSKG